VLNFHENRKFLDNEFINANWDKSSGLDASVLDKKIKAFIDSHLDLPMALLRAKTFEYLIKNAQIEINPHNIFADKINVGVTYGPYDIFATKVNVAVSDGPPDNTKWAKHDLFCKNMYDRFNHEILSKEIPEDYKKREIAASIGVGLEWADFWHITPDWNYIFQNGLNGILKIAEKAKSERENDDTLTSKQRIFYDSVIISYNAILIYLDRVYYESLKYNIPEYSECIKWLRFNPPETFYQVLQLTHIFVSMIEIGIERSRTLGRVDRLYYPYYRHDLENGIYTKDEVKEMLRFFFNKWNAARRFAAQPLALGGANEDGTDASNEITNIILVSRHISYVG